MGKVDNEKVAKRVRGHIEMSQDFLTKADLKKAKKKERQAGKKQARKALKD
jgi:hypothetical protein